MIKILTNKIKFDCISDNRLSSYILLKHDLSLLDYLDCEHALKFQFENKKLPVTLKYVRFVSSLFNLTKNELLNLNFCSKDNLLISYRNIYPTLTPNSEIVYIEFSL
jgi:hypothetical protein